MSTVDPHVYAVAELFIHEMQRTGEIPTNGLVPPTPVLVQRAAEAMQQAIEQECEAIREELMR